MARCLQAYSDRFEPGNGTSRAQWEAARRARITARTPIAITLHNLQVTLAGDQATAKFQQNQVTGSPSTTIPKVLSLRNESGNWRIVRESTGS